MPEEKRIILKHADEPGYTRDIECYLKHGGYEVLRKSYKLKPEEIHSEVMDSGLRGRGRCRIPHRSQVEVFRSQVWKADLSDMQCR